MTGQKKNGFTLVEALVALTILTVGLVPAFIQARNALNLSGSIRNNLIAAHLAQEGTEVMRAIRDGDWLAGQPFGKSLDACITGCRVQWNSQAPLPLAGNPKLLLNANNGLFQYTSGTRTQFSRSVVVTRVSNNERKIVVTVSWKERSDPKTFSIEYHVYNWLQ